LQAGVSQPYHAKPFGTAGCFVGYNIIHSASKLNNSQVLIACSHNQGLHLPETYNFDVVETPSYTTFPPADMFYPSFLIWKQNTNN